MAEWNTGEKNGMWRGGRSIASNGYVLIRVGVEHHLADVRGYAYEHRVVAEEKIGRRLLPGEQVHHINEVKSDNRPENLDVVTASEHHAEHREHDRGLRMPGEPNPEIACACGCRVRFPKYDSSNRPRRFAAGHNPHPAPTVDAIRAVLARGEHGVDEIAAAVGKPDTAVRQALSKASRAGVIRRVGHGRYAA